MNRVDQGDLWPHPDERESARDRTAPPCAFVIFGATGDLASRKLIPALYELHRSGRLNPGTSIVGYGRSDWNDEEFRRRAKEALGEDGDIDGELWQRLAARLRYVQGDYTPGSGYERLRKVIENEGHVNAVYYTATPPSAYGPICEGLSAEGLSRNADGWTRLVIEKPFGHDLASARELNRLLSGHFEENQLFRIDHYLAKETAQNLAVLRFANTVFEPLWSNRYVDNVQLTMAESVGVEGRGGFYERSGVVRDVFQNHLLQLLALVAMEPPARFEATSVRNEKVKVFEAMGCVEPQDAVFGQYVASNGMAGYREEPGVTPDSNQATFAAARFEISNWRWSGVPFYVRSGKRLEDKATEIVLRFRNPPHIPFELSGEPKPDRLVLRLAPDEGVRLRFNTKVPGRGIDLERANMEFTYADRFGGRSPDAYETLLLDTMIGDATLFMRSDEVEAQWRVVAPLLEQQDHKKVNTYPAGSMGPEQAARLIERGGRSWHRPGHTGPT